MSLEEKYFPVIENYPVSKDDKDILKKACLTNNTQLVFNCSFFSKKFHIENINNYNVIKLYLNEGYYYVNGHYGGGVGTRFFLDSEKKVIPYGRWWLFHDIISFLFHFGVYFYVIGLDFKNAIDIGENFIICEHWHPTYGHFKDEVYTSYDYYNKMNSENRDLYKILIEYETGKEYTKNYGTISKYVFEGKEINLFDYGKEIIKLNNIDLINHRGNFPSFHSFPYYISQKVLNLIPFNQDEFIHNKVFITRGIAHHQPRNLDNQTEIENYFKDKEDFLTVNPENISLEQFINTIRNADIVVITWGSALVNLTYLKPNTNVIILKSRSYESEGIYLFQKIIDQTKLNINIITHIDNKINMNQLDEILKKIS